MLLTLLLCMGICSSGGGDINSNSCCNCNCLYCDYNCDRNYYSSNNVNYGENVTQTWTKLNVGVRMNFHYARSISENLDLYSGFRVGYSNWNKKNDSTDPDYFSLIDEIKIPLAFQIVPIGVRYFFTDLIGVHFETGVIGPYYAAGGVSFKL